METLLEVGLVEALAAAVFVGFCLFISYLLQPRKVYERRLSQILDQIAEPERSVPTQLTYRGAPYVPPGAASVPEEVGFSANSQRAETEPVAPVQTTTPIVQLTYRGVPYGQAPVVSSDAVSSGDRPQ